MQLTISKKLYGLGLLGLLFTLAAGITGAWGITRVAGGIDDVSRLSSVIRNHIQASMFLDWSRTDISKMLTTTGETQATAASELENHQQLFVERLDAAKSFAKDPETRTVSKRKAAWRPSMFAARRRSPVFVRSRPRPPRSLENFCRATRIFGT